MDEAARERIIRIITEHQQSLLRMSYLYLHDAHLAEDAVQETFIRAMRALPSFRGEMRHVATEVTADGLTADLYLRRVLETEMPYYETWSYEIKAYQEVIGMAEHPDMDAETFLRIFTGG